jgi:ATP-binding cassette, subfamily C, bacterial EexD
MNFKIPRNLKMNKSELWLALNKSRDSFVYTAFVSMFINILMLVPSIYMLQLYDRVLASRSEYTLLMLTIITAILFVMLGSLELIRSRILVRVGNKIDAELSSRIFGAMFAMANKYPGKASSQALNDLTQIRQFMTGTPLFAFFDAPWMPIYIAILFMFDVYFGIFAIFAAIVILSLTLINDIKTKEELENANKTYQSSTAFISASLRNAEVIEAMGMHENIKQRWMGRYIDFLNMQSKASDEAGLWSNASKTLRMLFQSLILGLGGLLVIEGHLTPGMMIAGSIIMGRALAPLDLLTSSWKQFVNARQSYYRLESLLEEFPEAKEPTPLPAPVGNISVENLIVVPPNSQIPSLKGITLSITAGEIVAIIGPSAAGKSTLARTMLGVWKPHAGKVRIDSAELTHWNKAELGKHIGYLPQDIELFEGTVSENIARYNEPDPAKVIEAAQIAGVHDMILHLPNGYDTPIGVGGATLSGGQRQRIGLARAIYDFPKIIILDEPNSNLDDLGEQALVNAILYLKKKGATIVLITHRPAILGITDKIALLVDGTLKMYGPSADVLNALAPKQIQQAQPEQQQSLNSGGE